MTVIKFNKKGWTPLSNGENAQFADRMSKKRQIAVFLVVFVCPFLSLIFLSMSHVLNADISIIRVYEAEDFLNLWEAKFGPFIRNYYFENSIKKQGGNIAQEEVGIHFPWDKLPNPPPATKEQCANIKEELRFDCFPRGPVTEKSCIERGCCYNNITTKPEVPICFYPKMFRSYKYTNINCSEHGITALLQAQFKSPYSSDTVNLKIDFRFFSDEILFINISDADKVKFRFPFPEEPAQIYHPQNPLYEVKVNNETSGFKIIRKSNNRTIIDSEDIGGFIYSDQFMQFSSILPSKHIYGLGEHRNDFLLNTNWKTITLFTHDAVPQDNINGYGYHPFYLCMEGDGLSHGVLAWTGHAMDVVLQPGPAVTFRAIGGNLGFFVMLGPSPIEVVQEYTHIVGRPMLPPYWSFGFHLCRFGYKTVNDMYKVWNRTRAAGIPFDTQWTDLDYMDRRNDFTIDPVNYKGLQDFVQLIHDAGMHYMLIIDPGIGGSEPAGTYPPYDEGLTEKIFVMDHSGKTPFIGQVWNPKATVFPDFSHPKAVQYWLNQLKSLYDKVPFDGAWIDMNEPSNFLDGEASGCPKNSLDHPPYVPGVDGGQLCHKTLCMSAVHHFGKHYDIHNIYGSLEMVITSFAMAQIRESRPFVISRSTSPGVGKYGGHWTGDVVSNWDDMKHSVADIMSFSLFGIPMVGADICGFNGNTTPSLCQRWSQLGAFYPFSRNHNSDDAIEQDPVALGAAVASSAKNALMTRYTLLPHFYTIFWHASSSGTPVIQPLLMQFPTDVNTYNISTQFLWGSSLLVAPVLEEGLMYVKAYLPNDVWYNFYTAERIDSKGQFFALAAPLDVIPLLQRGGSVIPTQEPGVTTRESRKNHFSLSVALDRNSHAVGELYWDDGESIGDEFNLIQFESTTGKFESKVKFWKYNVKMPLKLITVFSVPKVSKVEMYSKSVQFTYNATSQVLRVDLSENNVDLGQDLTLLWS